MKNRWLLLIYSVMTLSLFAETLNAQDNNRFMHSSRAEKIYLQLDNEVYTNNKTIWFKAIVVNAATHKFDRSSGVLYIDLIDSGEKIITTKLIKISNGIGQGHIDLDNRIIPGTYLIRAYTEFNKNFGNDFVYEKYIQVYEPTINLIAQGPIRNIRRIEKSPLVFSLRADLDPNMIDDSHESDLKVILKSQRENDTLLIKKKKGKYALEYNLNESKSISDIEIITSNNRSYSQRLLDNKGTIDIQFFPESGNLVNGISSKVGFKALSSNGKGKYVKGFIYNSNNERVAYFESNPLGMGSFILKPVNSSDSYRAVIDLEDSKNQQVFNLPKVLPKGEILSIEEKRDSLLLTLSVFPKTSRSYLVEGISRGYKYFSSTLKLSDGKANFVLPKNRFPEGVLAFTVYADNRMPVAERLVFNQRLDRRLKIDAEVIKKNIDYREAVNINFEIKADDKPSKANLSLLVLPSNSFSMIRRHSNHILSYFLLSSDIRGKIENPSSYFENNSDLNIDDLMLTQGWRKFKYIEPLRLLKNRKEMAVEITGVINSRVQKSVRDSVDLMLMTFDKERTVYTKSVKVPGNFSFDLIDSYESQLDLAIQPINLPKKQIKDYTIAFTTKHELPLNFEFKNSYAINDSLINYVVNSSINQKDKEDKFYFENYGTQLNEVVIDGYRITPKRKEIAERYGKPSVVIEEKEIREQEQEWSFGLVSVLEDFFRDRIRIERDLDGTPRIIALNELGRSGVPTLVTVDGVPVRDYEYSLLQSISVDEVKSFEVIDNADRFGTLYLKVYPGSKPPIPSRGSVVVIYTKTGKGLYGALGKKTQDAKIFKVPVFSLQKEFYTPQYEDPFKIDYKVPDVRLPIYWNPNLEIERNGKLRHKFYHSDDKGDFIVIVEAISPSGQIGYIEFNYSVGNGAGKDDN